MAGRRVVVTGLGLVTPLGNCVVDTWSGIVAGKSGIAPIDKYDVGKLTVKIAGMPKEFDVTQLMSAKEARRIDVFIHYAIAAAREALRHSGYDVSDTNAHRVATCVGSGIGGITSIEDHCHILRDVGPRKISPFFVAGAISNMAAGNVSIDLGLKGPSICVSTACTSGTHNIGMAARMIAYGEADAAIAGGAECGSSPIGMAGFAAARALSTRNDDPQAASRPWDEDRDGFVLSDGAGMLMLEEYESAKSRGAEIHAELIGFGMSSDAFHITAPPEDGEGAAAAMRHALQDARLNPEQIDYINAHGTSTPVGDKVEAVAIERVFPQFATHLVVSSTKSMTGHMLGAAGAVEAVLSVLSIQHQVVPPTINFNKTEIGTSLDFVPNQSRARAVRCVMTNSFGFGGTNSTLIFKSLS